MVLLPAQKLLSIVRGVCALLQVYEPIVEIFHISISQPPFLISIKVVVEILHAESIPVVDHLCGLHVIHLRVVFVAVFDLEPV